MSTKAPEERIAELEAALLQSENREFALGQAVRLAKSNTSRLEAYVEFALGEARRIEAQRKTMVSTLSEIQALITTECGISYTPSDSIQDELLVLKGTISALEAGTKQLILERDHARDTWRKIAGERLDLLTKAEGRALELLKLVNHRTEPNSTSPDRRHSPYAKYKFWQWMWVTQDEMDSHKGRLMALAAGADQEIKELKEQLRAATEALSQAQHPLRNTK